MILSKTSDNSLLDLPSPLSPRAPREGKRPSIEDQKSLMHKLITEELKRLDMPIAQMKRELNSRVSFLTPLPSQISKEKDESRKSSSRL